jgi:hypothetical protein
VLAANAGTPADESDSASPVLPASSSPQRQVIRWRASEPSRLSVRLNRSLTHEARSLDRKGGQQ